MGLEACSSHREGRHPWRQTAPRDGEFRVRNISSGWGYPLPPQWNGDMSHSLGKERKEPPGRWGDSRLFRLLDAGMQGGINARRAGSTAHRGGWAAHTHGGREDDDAQHVHAVAGARLRLVNDLGRWGQVQGEVLHTRAILLLDPIDEDRSWLKFAHLSLPQDSRHFIATPSPTFANTWCLP